MVVQNKLNSMTLYLTLFCILVSNTLLFGCVETGDSDKNNNNPITLNMNLPDSMTGGKSAVASPTVQKATVFAASVTSKGTGQPCFYNGEGKDDPFGNGFAMTRFMVSVVATWTCVTDTIMDIVTSIPHDGAVVETENDKAAENYDSSEPTHYSVTNDSDTQTTVRLYYGFTRELPPTSVDEPQFFVSWNVDSNDNVSGRLVIDGTGIDSVNRDPEDPSKMRIDFTYTDTQKLADMFLQFDSGNLWADGLRIEVNRDLTAIPTEEVFRARGLMAMKRQFLENTGISELPLLQIFTVSDSFGEGAAIAEFEDVALPLELNANTANHLGDYIFNKQDKYFFKADQSVNEPWDWIEKTFSNTEYRGNRTTLTSGGTWIPFDPSLDMIISELALDPNYFTGTLCNNVGDVCTDLLNTIFANGFADQPPNQGSDPNDWRSTAVVNPNYLSSVYPNGLNWDGAFDTVFIP